ncbi:hypothetical protein AB0K89_20305, partial [Streptomyces cinnamoneus]|uniref:hypothetical protein n=1 Tax=Streptomyces cinnamoneus TaxID=53446 RepID=UPI0034460B13
MTAPDDLRLGQLVARLRAADWDLSAEELADAVWLAQWAGRGAPAPPGDGPAAGPVGLIKSVRDLCNRGATKSQHVTSCPFSGESLPMV